MKLEAVRRGGVICMCHGFLSLYYILVDGTGHKIAMSMAVGEQFISGDLPA